MAKLLLIGSGSVHTYNYHQLIENYFDDILLITDAIRPEYQSVHAVLGDFSIRNPIRAFENYRFIRKQISLFQPDIIHVHQANATAFLSIKAAKKSGIPVIVTAWGSDVLLAPEQSHLINKMIVYNLDNADYLTADSKNVAAKIRERAKLVKHDVLIANFGVDEFYEEIPKENIIYSNRLHNKLYRIDEVIKAFSRFIKNDTQHWKLIIAGEGSETENLKALVEKLNLAERVEFVGWLNKNENYAYYNRAKIFISIPGSDATAISLLEAMSAGCLPVVSNLPANEEWISDGENGIIVKDLNADYLQLAVDLDMKKAKKINRGLIRREGTKAVNREKFIRLYQKITEGKL